MLLGGVCALILGTLFKFRFLPFLKSDTILSGGSQVPTVDFAASMAHWFYIFGTACILCSVIWWVIRAKKGRL